VKILSLLNDNLISILKQVRNTTSRTRSSRVCTVARKRKRKKISLRLSSMSLEPSNSSKQVQNILN